MADDPLTAPPALRLSLELEPLAEPIAGRLFSGAGSGDGFVGYMQLIALLERVRAEASQGSS